MCVEYRFACVMLWGGVCVFIKGQLQVTVLLGCLVYQLPGIRLSLCIYLCCNNSFSWENVNNLPFKVPMTESQSSLCGTNEIFGLPY